MDHAIHAANLVKHYGENVAVDDLSFDVRYGEIFGLLGPNGAGKTSTIRMLLGLLAPTSGDVRVLGAADVRTVLPRVGYLPEERGLYRDVRVDDCLVYLAELKGVPRREARRRVTEGLVALDLPDVERRAIKTLSRGQQQKVQFLATVLHRPELLIIDEPFSGLDPVNTRVLRDFLLGLHATGTTIVMCTHQMNRVEELCERLLMLQDGRPVLYGGVQAIRRDFAGDRVRILLDDAPPDAAAQLAGLPGVVEVQSSAADGFMLRLAPGAGSAEVMAGLVDRPSLAVQRFEAYLPSLEEIFLRVAGDDAPPPPSAAPHA
ncbi:MAG: ATP-binding cassette domain-containing protein [Ardenticatenales bacterium]